VASVAIPVSLFRPHKEKNLIDRKNMQLCIPWNSTWLGNRIAQTFKDRLMRQFP
jgi:hypothetical protein